MIEKTFPTQPGTQLEVHHVGGDLTAKGWQRDHLKFVGLEDENQISQAQEKFQVQAAGDLMIYLPDDLQLSLQKVGGDVVIKGLRQPLEIHQVGGDLFLSDLSSPHIHSVGGDLFAKHIRGDLSSQHVGGDSTVQDVDGQCALESTSGDAVLSGINGGVNAEAGGSIHAHLSPVSWQAYDLQAGEDIDLRIPEDTDAEITCRSEEGEINLFLKDGEHTFTKELHHQVLGEGGPPLTLTAGGRISVSTRSETWTPSLDFHLDIDPDLSAMAEEITNQAFEELEKHLNELENHLEEPLSGMADSLEFSPDSLDDLDKLQKKILKASQKSTRKAQKIARKTQAKVEKKLAQAQRRAEKKGRSPGSFDFEAFLGQKQAQDSLDEERMLILKMLQDKKITAEQADDLLSALEEKD